MTDNYYDQNAEDYFAETYGVDMASIYSPFLELVKPGGCIVDAGCGSGRDAEYFAGRGYRVMGFDASRKLVELARKHTGVDVRHCTFLEFSSELASVDGIWACASLLHLPYDGLSDVFVHLAQYLIPGGVVYCSFKYGEDEAERGGRYFTDMTEKRLQSVLDRTNLLPEKLWLTEDLCEGCEDKEWLNGLLRKCD